MSKILVDSMTGNLANSFKKSVGLSKLTIFDEFWVNSDHLEARKCQTRMEFLDLYDRKMRWQAC